VEYSVDNEEDMDQELEEVEKLTAKSEDDESCSQPMIVCPDSCRISTYGSASTRGVAIIELWRTSWHIDNVKPQKRPNRSRLERLEEPIIPAVASLSHSRLIDAKTLFKPYHRRTEQPRTNAIGCTWAVEKISFFDPGD